MTFDWSDYLDFAEEVSRKNSATEAEVRSAISRTYYSVHNLASASTPKSGKVEINNSHRNLVSRYKFDKINTNYQEAGKILGGLKRDRHTADYDSDSSKLGQNLNKKLQSVILQAKEFKRLADL